MTHCEVCHSRIYTYKTFKIGIKTVCYHCKIKDLEEKLKAEKKITAWGIAEDLAKLTDLGVDEAHDVVVGIIKKRGGKLVQE